MITPIELHNKQHKAGRGYKKKEMDLFLDEVFESYEHLYKENVELKDKISRLSDGVQQYKTMETALQKALVLAEKTSKDTIESASHKADVIEKEARLKANTIVNEALSKSEEIKKQCILLLKQYNQFKAQYKQIALKQIELLDGDFYEIYSKDLIDALNEASEGNVADDNVFEDENISGHEDVSDDENVTEHENVSKDENVSEDRTVSADENAPLKNVSKHENIAEKNNMTEHESVPESGNIFMNESVSGKENDVSLNNHIERAITLSSDITEHKEDADAEISVPSGDTKEFTPLETKAIERESRRIPERKDMQENSRIREGDRIQKNREMRENNGIQKNSGMQDDDEKLDRSIRKLRSQLADDRKAENPGSSFEFFDN